MKTVCKSKLCDACMACVTVCDNAAIDIVEEIDCCNAVINEKCINCGKCYRICQRNNPPQLTQPYKWYQGWASSEESRIKSASGGLAFEIGKSFIENGGIVVACVFSHGELIYTAINQIGELEKIRGSKYIKSNPEDIYITVKELLNIGKKVLTIGLPCHISALRKIVAAMPEKRGELFLIDLICHGTPSILMFDTFLKQYGLSVEKFENIKFRNKEKFSLEESGVVPFGYTDRYTIGYLDGLLHTDNCYHCQYAGINRTGDITIGDSWGTNLGEEERKKGISLILVQNDKGMSLLNGCHIELKDVKLDTAISANRQLQKTSEMPKYRDKFLRMIKAGVAFNLAIEKCLPIISFKKDIKGFLIAHGMWGGVKDSYRISYFILETQKRN